MDNILHLFGFPYSALLATSFLLAVGAVFRFWGDLLIVKKLASLRTAQILLAIGAMMLAVEGTLSIPIHGSIVFVIYALVLMTSLLLTVLFGIKRKAKIGFLFNHAGILLIVWAALFGAPDVDKMKVVVSDERPQNIAYHQDKKFVRLPFEIALDKFTIDYYEDGMSPKQFTSKLTVAGKKMVTAVNSPCSYGGYTIFQDGYDPEEGRYTILQMVKDPWLPFVYLGMVLLAAGSVMLLFGKWKAKVVVPVALLLTVLFTILTVAKINFGTLMPALRSWWFVPHLFIYMVAYALMAMGLVCDVIRRIKDGKSNSNNHDNVSPKTSGYEVGEMLIRSSAALLIIGMLTGSVWARQAWGDYWAWDAKENWAAVTWFVSLIYLHLSNKKSSMGVAIIVLAFLALQITWYGVNYLPSAQNSMHTYNN